VLIIQSKQYLYIAFTCFVQLSAARKDQLITELFIKIFAGWCYALLHRTCAVCISRIFTGLAEVVRPSLFQFRFLHLRFRLKYFPKKCRKTAIGTICAKILTLNAEDRQQFSHFLRFYETFKCELW